jgi:hypothetical protein
MPHRPTEPDCEEIPLIQTLTSRLAAAAAVLLLSACASVMPVPDVPQRAGTANPPRSILYVGNSFMYYNNSLHGHVGLLARASADKQRAAHRSTSLTISGSGIDWHDVAAYLKPDQIGRYSFVGDNEIRFNPPGRQFDAAMLMDCSQCPVHPQLRPVFFEYAKKHSDTLRRNGVEPMFLMTWAYKDKPEMTEGLADAYTEAGRLNRAHVIPAGLAFARSIAKRPELDLYVPDKRHPSVAGTYLTACTVLASVMGVNPVGNPYIAGLDPAVARHLQEMAWETVQAYRR